MSIIWLRSFLQRPSMVMVLGSAAAAPEKGHRTMLVLSTPIWRIHFLATRCRILYRPPRRGRCLLSSLRELLQHPLCALPHKRLGEGRLLMRRHFLVRALTPYGTRRRLQATTPICSVSCNSCACQLRASRVTALPFVSVSNGASIPSYSSRVPFQCRLQTPHGILRPLQCCWCPLDRAGSDDANQMWGCTKWAAPEGQKQEL